MKVAKPPRSMQIDPEERTAIIEQAIREGRHEADMSTWRTVCGGCGKWVDAIWFVNEQGTRLGKCCSPKDRK